MNKPDIRRMFESMKTGLSEALRSGGQAAERAVQAVSQTVSAAIHDPRAAGADLRERAADCASVAVGALRHLGHRVGRVARGAMLGALRGVKDHHVWVVEIVESVSASMVHKAIDEQLEIAPVVRGALEGAEDAAQELGFSAAEARTSAARGAARAASAHGEHALSQVHEALPANIDWDTLLILQNSGPSDAESHWLGHAGE